MNKAQHSPLPNDDEWRLAQWGEHSPQTSVRWAQIAGERQNAIESLQGECDHLRNHAEALAEALREIVDHPYWKGISIKAREALANWEGVK